MCEATAANDSAAFMYLHIGMCVCVFVAFSLRVATPTYGI